ncbi:RNA polymerase sigma factor [Corynebacterium epidermidicanis]|uniref:DNA-directed RNA polymerase specialized sigma subunit, sigma24 n=1 Tax=Corynebacterium epidermidicanis TaxID=1050174 RepID=A0A0G3GZT1_9CORY|nr:sigma-70 family RNA polymerase sigma factor [Corynebacterium epidermidicanis]AKK04352.1 DNA-directed RNA polymerase specialized sigma subunit, sigma24 [Corynebacterium epidermidicanis]
MPDQTNYASFSDAQLVHHYISGDEAAFAQIVHRYRRAMWWVAHRYSECEHDIHDILQESFFRASLTLHQFRSDCSLRTWLYRLVSNAGYDLRKRSRLVQLTEDGELPELGYNPLQEWDVRLTVTLAVAMLKPEHRMVLLLVDLLGHTVPQVSRMTGITEGTIKSRRSRARQQVKLLVGA